MRPVLRVALACAAIAGTAAGCGEDREEDQALTRGADTATGTVPAAAAGGRLAATVQVSETEFALEPPDTRVARPGLIAFEVHNDGEVPHALAVAGPAGETRTPVLASGEATTLAVELPAGTYKWFCPLADHERRGMAGRVRVAE